MGDDGDDELRFDDASTVARPRFQPTPPADDTLVLTVVEGPDRGKSHAFDGLTPAPVRVGTSPACELRLTDREVSRRHLAIEIVGKKWRVSDLGSTNGTRVDGTEIDAAYLVGGEKLRVGATTVEVQRRHAAAPALPGATAFGRLVGASTEMRRLYPLCERLAASSMPVIIEGETGTGKEVLAESLHERGPRSSGPYVVFDCTAVPPSLLESELFGHEKGSFTGAVATRKGVFEQAHGGTLLIDEIGDLDIALQPKLLRAIERSEVRRVGGDRSIKVDVRVLAATRRDLDREIAAGRFRDDLFHRLAVARIELPPLRRRKGDVQLLARHFALQLGGDGSIPNDVLMRWEDSSWPGNVREFRNAVARHLAFGEFADLVPSSSEPPAEGAPADALDEVLALRLPFPEARRRVVEEFERRYVRDALDRHGARSADAAAASGIARRYFDILKARVGK